MTSERRRLFQTFFCRLIQLLNFSKHRYEFFSPFFVNLLIMASFFQTISYAVHQEWDEEVSDEPLENKLFLGLSRVLVLVANPSLLIFRIPEDSFNMVLLIGIFTLMLSLLICFFLYFSLLVVEYRYEKRYKAGFLYKYLRITISIYIWVLFIPCSDVSLKIFSGQAFNIHQLKDEQPVSNDLIPLGYFFAFISYFIAVFCAFMGRRINFLDGRLNYRFTGTTVLVITGKFLIVLIRSGNNKFNTLIIIGLTVVVILLQCFEFFHHIPFTDPKKCVSYCRVLFCSLIAMVLLAFKRIKVSTDSQENFVILLITQTLVFRFASEVWRLFYEWIMSVDFSEISLIDRRSFFYVSELYRLLIALEKGDILAKIRISGMIRVHIFKCKQPMCFCKTKTFEISYRSEYDLRKAVLMIIESTMKTTILEGDKHSTAKLSITKYPEDFEFFSYIFVTFYSDVMENAFSGLFWLIKYREKIKEMDHHSLLFKIVYDPLLSYLEYYTINKNLEKNDPRGEILFDKIDYGSLLIQFHNWEKERMIIKIKLEKIINAKVHLWNSLEKGLNDLNQFLSQSQWIVDELISLEINHFDKIPTENSFLYIYCLKLYSMFLGRVLNNPAEARLLEMRIIDIRRKESQNMHQEINLSTLLSGDIVTVTASFLKNKGYIVYSSTYAWSFFGYSAPQEFQANVTYIESLMPKAISKEHNNLVQRFLRRGTSKILRKARRIICINKQNFIFAAKLFLEHNFQARDDLLITALILKIKGNSGFILTDNTGFIQAISEEAFGLFKNHELLSLDLIHKANVCLFMPGLVEYFKKINSLDSLKDIHDENNMKIKCFIPRKVDKHIIKFQTLGIEEMKCHNSIKLEKLNNFVKRTLYFGSEIFMLSLNILCESLGDIDDSNGYLFLFEITSFAKQKITLEKQEKKGFTFGGGPKNTQETFLKLLSKNYDPGTKKNNRSIIDWNPGLEGTGLQAAESSNDSSSETQSDFVPPIYHNAKTRQTILIHKVDSPYDASPKNPSPKHIVASPSTRRSSKRSVITLQKQIKEEEEDPNQDLSIIEFEESHLNKFPPRGNMRQADQLVEEHSLIHSLEEIDNYPSKREERGPERASFRLKEILKIEENGPKNEELYSKLKADAGIETDNNENIEEKKKKITMPLRLNTTVAKGFGMAISASALKVGKALLNAAFFYGQELEDEDGPRTINKSKTDLEYNKDELLVEDIQSEHYKVEDLNINRSMTVSTKSGVSERTTITDITNLSKSKTLPTLLKFLILMNILIIVIFLSFNISIGIILRQNYENFRGETYMIGFSSELLSPTGFLIVGGYFQLYFDKYYYQSVPLKYQDQLQYLVPIQTNYALAMLNNRVRFELTGNSLTQYQYLFNTLSLNLEYYYSGNSSKLTPLLPLSEALRFFVINGRNVVKYIETFNDVMDDDDDFISGVFTLKQNFLTLSKNVLTIQLKVNSLVQDSKDYISYINQVSMFTAVFTGLFLIAILYPIYNRYLNLIDSILHIITRISEEEIKIDHLILQETLMILKAEKDSYIDWDFSNKNDLRAEDTRKRIIGKKDDGGRKQIKTKFLNNRIKYPFLSRRYMIPFLLIFFLIFLAYFLTIYFIVDAQISNFQPSLQFANHFSRAKTELMKAYTYTEVLINEKYFNKITKSYPGVKNQTAIGDALNRSKSLFKTDLTDWILSGTVNEYYSAEFRQDLSAILNEDICIEKYLKGVDSNLCRLVMSGALSTGMYTALLALENYINNILTTIDKAQNITNKDVRALFESDNHLETYIGIIFITKIMDYYMLKILNELRQLLQDSSYSLNIIFIVGSFFCVFLNYFFLRKIINRMFSFYRISVWMLRLIPYHKVMDDKSVNHMIKKIAKK